MMQHYVYDQLLMAYRAGRALLFILLDPDKIRTDTIADFVRYADAQGVDGFLVGDSLSMQNEFEAALLAVKSATAKPVIIFPGGVHQISGAADAILFLSVISGRNPDLLIGQHIVGAPIIRRLGLEAISTGYMIVASDIVTNAEFMSASKPIPREKPELAAAHGMAAELLGMKLLYLEAGSGASQSVPVRMVQAVRSTVDIPIIVGGGIRSPEEAREKVLAGASIVVIGNHFEDDGNRDQLADFVKAVYDPTVREA